MLKLKRGSVTTKTINVELKSGNTNKQIKTLDKNMRGLGAEADKTSKSIDKTSKSLFSLSKVASGVIASLGVAQIKAYADNWTNANNRISAATKTLEEFETAQKGVLAIAQEAGVDLNGVADSYSRIAQATSELGVSQDRVLDVTRKVTLALKAGGATAAETSSVLVQFAQGLGSGALQGDELKSILEASIPITKALAKEFNTTTGGLKKLGAEGKLTADRVVQAIEGIDQASLTFERDIAGGIAVANNAITVYVGKLDQALGATKSINGVLTTFSENVEVIAQSIAFVSGLLIAKYAASLGVVLASQLLLIERTTRATLVTNSYGQVIERTSRASNVAAIATRGLSSAVALLGGPVGVITLAVTALSLFVTQSDLAKSAADRYVESIDELEKSTDGAAKSQDELNKRLKESLSIELKGKIADVTAEISKLQKQSAGRESGGITKLKGDLADLEQQLFRLESFASKGDILKGVFTSSQTGGKDSSLSGGLSTGSKPEAPQSASTDISALRSRLALETDALAAELDNQRALRNGEINQRQFDDEAELQQLRFKFEERRLAIEENEALTATQRAQLKLDLGEQELIAEEIFQQRMTQIKDDGVNDRRKLDLLESNARISNIQNTANSGLKLLSAFGDKSFKTQKKFAIADSIISITSGVAKALNNPYPANLAFAAQVAASGASLLSTIKSTNPSSGGSSGSVGATSAPVAAVPQQQPESIRETEIRGIEDLKAEVREAGLLNDTTVIRIIDSISDYQINNG